MGNEELPSVASGLRNSPETLNPKPHVSVHGVLPSGLSRACSRFTESAEWITPTQRFHVDKCYILVGHKYTLYTYMDRLGNRPYHTSSNSPRIHSPMPLKQQQGNNTLNPKKRNPKFHSRIVEQGAAGFFSPTDVFGCECSLALIRDLRFRAWA